jgi:hypothetical protein
VKTPITDKGLRKYDHLSPEEAAKAAWKNPGRYPSWHTAAQRQVEAAMPLLARALKRLEKE